MMGPGVDLAAIGGIGMGKRAVVPNRGRGGTAKNVTQPKSVTGTTGTWRTLDTTGVVVCDFQPGGVHQVRIVLGDIVRIQEETTDSFTDVSPGAKPKTHTTGWYKGEVVSRGTIGIFPKAYIHAPHINPWQNDAPMLELTSVIREWTGLLGTYFQERRVVEYRTIRQRLLVMMDWYKKINSLQISDKIRVEMKMKVLTKIEEGRRVMGLDVIIRNGNGERADERNTGVIELYRQHQELSLPTRSRFQQSTSPTRSHLDASDSDVISPRGTSPMSGKRGSGGGGAGDGSGGDTQWASSGGGGWQSGGDGDGGPGGGIGKRGSWASPSDPRKSKRQSSKGASGFFLTSPKNRRKGAGQSVVLPPLSPPLGPASPPLSPTMSSSSPYRSAKSSTTAAEAAKKLADRKTMEILQSPSAELARVIKAHRGADMYHIMLELKIVMLPLAEGTHEVYFAVYNRTTQSFLTENYVVILTHQGMPVDQEKIGNIKTVFVDIPAKDMESDLYLVCRMIRRGRMLLEGKGSKNMAMYRRPHCTAVHSLQSFIGGCISSGLTTGTGSGETEVTFPVYTTAQDAMFHNAVELILKKQNVEAIPKSKGICVSLQVFRGSYDDVQKNGGSIFKGVPTTKKLGFPEIILPGDERNDFYVTLDGGEVSQERKSTAKNVEVIVTVKDANGNTIPNCIHAANGIKMASEYRSFVLYHSNNPRWNETIRIDLPHTDYRGAHLFFNIRHCSTRTSKGKDKGFANSFIRLVGPDHTVVRDGSHTVALFKAIERPTAVYLSQYPDGIGPRETDEVEGARKGESLKVTTRFTSTKLTQNPSIHGILNWKTYEGNLSEVLKRITFVDSIDIIKFLQEIFDACFEIMEGKANEVALQPLIYDAVVFVITILVDDKTSHFTNYKPVLDLYIREHFRGHLAYKQMMAVMKESFTTVDANPAKIIASLKALEYTLKIVIASQKLHSKSLSVDDNRSHLTSFKRDLLQFFFSFNQLMTKTSPQLIGAQTVALKNFSKWFVELQRVFDTRELSAIACKFVDSVQFSEKKTVMNVAKLRVVMQLVSGPLYMDNRARKIMMPTVLKQMKLHMTSVHNEELKQCTAILMEILDATQLKLDKAAQNESLADMVGLVPEIVHTITHFERQAEWGPRLDVVVSLLAIFYLMTGQHFVQFVKTYENDREKRDMLLSVFDLVSSFIRGNTFPENWLTLIMFQFVTIKKVTMSLSAIVGERMTVALEATPSAESFEAQEFLLWEKYFLLCLAFINSRALNLEKFPPNKRMMLKGYYGDMRLDLSKNLSLMWDSLGLLQTQFIDSLVPRFLQLMLVGQKDLKEVGMDMYFSVLEREFRQHGSIKRVETNTIDSMDQIMDEGTTDDVRDFASFFLTRLKEKVSGVAVNGEADRLFCKQAHSFVDDNKLLLNLLIELRTLPQTPAYEDDRTIATMQLMEYLKVTGRVDKYVRYVQVLCTQHMQSGNFAEAGYTLLLHSDMLEWSQSDLLEAQNGMPQESSFARKESLYHRIIEYFEQAKLFEKAIDLLRVLAYQYETCTYDYERLADTLEQTARLYRAAIKEHRFYPEYFRVGYYGQDFPPNIKGREFIYRGFELEKLSDFADRIKVKFPQATKLTYTEPPPQELIDGPGQHLQIFAVKPERCENRAPLIDSPALKTVTTPPSSVLPPATIVEFTLNNDVNSFVYSRPYKKKKTGNEFRDLFMMNYHYTCEHFFPTIHRRTPIVSIRAEEWSPVQCAISTVEGKNMELVRLGDQFKDGQATNIAPFTMVVKGVIDAAVAGGIDMYRQAFFTPEYTEDNPTDIPHLSTLKESLRQQFTHLEKALGIHGAICPSAMHELQEFMEMKFEELSKDVGWIE